MSKHKAPTQVTIAPTEEQSAFAAFVHRAWKPFVGISIAVLGLVYFRGMSQESERETQYGDWDLVSSTLGLSLASAELKASEDEVQTLRESIKGQDAEPWAIYLGAVALTADKDWEGALAQLADLSAQHPNHILNTDTFEFDGTETPESIADHLKRVIADQKAWAAAHPELIGNPAPPEGSPRVRIVTEEGSLVVGLYPDRAPKHVENFVKLCSEGFYNDTLFHRVQPSLFIQAGDPNTKTDDQSTWGQGGPGYTIEPEESGLFHFEGTLAAAKKNQDSESSGSQFYLTVADVFGLDDQYVVFGTILEGLEVAAGIAEGEVTPPDSPVSPIKILSTEVL